MSLEGIQTQALSEHGLEGAELLAAEPSRLLRQTNYLIAALLCTVIAWAFVAKADVIVTTTGTLIPEEDIRRVYTPIDGELVELYVVAGAPVQAGDILARINARGAINAASRAVEAKLRLSEAEFARERFPQRKALLQGKAKAMQARLEFLQQDYDRQIAEGEFKLAEAQRARLSEARNALEQAERRERTAQAEAEQFQRLFALDGGGGVSRLQVEQKRNDYLDAQTRTRNAQAQLSALEFELGNMIAQADKRVADSAQELAETRIQLATTLRDIEREEAEVEIRHRSARAAAEAAERLSFENFDDNNFLRVYAPISGIVTEIPLSQAGDKVQSSRPLLSIAPSGADKILRVRIDERDRGFLAVGQTAKLKFNAFPFQTYGSVDGYLDYISPTVASHATGPNSAASNAYVGKVRLATDRLQTPQGETRLRFGMGATAEIVVRERRVIDFVLDPLRRVTRS